MSSDDLEMLMGTNGEGPLGETAVAMGTNGDGLLGETTMVMGTNGDGPTVAEG